VLLPTALLLTEQTYSVALGFHPPTSSL
jgi:hypothetical protein